jgi:hypothetical protein
MLEMPGEVNVLGKMLPPARSANSVAELWQTGSDDDLAPSANQRWEREDRVHGVFEPPPCGKRDGSAK